MIRYVKLRPIDEIIAQVNAEMEASIESHIEYAKRSAMDTIQKINNTRQALALLDGAGVDMNIPSYSKGTFYCVDLGYFARTKSGSRALANQVRKIRLALGCRLIQEGKEIANGRLKHVNYMLKAQEFPGIQLRYQRKIPAGASCKIKTTRSSYRSLVCENL